MTRRFEVVTRYQNEDVTLPFRGTKKSAGYDMFSLKDYCIEPSTHAMVETGVKACMQDDEVLLMYIRSSLAKKGLQLKNNVGVIDADYYNNSSNEGHIMLMVYNTTSSPIKLKKGDRVAQGIFTKYLTTDDDNATQERNGGFGSTGKGVE